MKNNVILYVILFCFIHILNSCQDDKCIQNGINNDNVTILARLGDNLQTRTCVDNSSPEEITGILWSPKDTIGVFGNQGTKNALFESLNTTKVAEADFSGTLLSGESPIVAYYPYNAKNVSSDYSSLKGNLALVQTFNMKTGKLECDYKVGTPVQQNSDGRWEFEFEHLFSLLKFEINATGTVLEGEKLEQIILTLPKERKLGGEFNFDASTNKVNWIVSDNANNSLTMRWNDLPTLNSGMNYVGYITCAPNIFKEDDIKISILTTRYKADFTCKSLVNFESNTCYTFPLKLENYTDMVVSNRPIITSFSFEVSNNPGKILDKKLFYSAKSTRPEDVTVEPLTVEGNTISTCIPYLYDFKLKPTFTVNEGAIVTVNGVEQISGMSEQDFSEPVVYTVSNGVDSRDYVVSVTNTGLPIVVLTQSDGGSVDWPETGLKIRAKDEEWVETDKIAIYNANGSIDLPEAFCGIRLRGNSTQEYPKKPFAIKLVNKAPILGMPKHKRWVLLANWMDRTMLRNAVAFEAARQTADAYNDGLGWNPRGYNVELVIEGRHVGNYYLCEQIKIDKDRVNIKDCYEDVLEDNPNLTVADCGYLLEFDDNFDEVNKFRTERGLPCMFKDEVPAESEFFYYVKDKVEAIEDNLNNGNFSAAYNDLDINSVIDYFFVLELSLNDELKHPKSVYMYIDGSGKLTAGPVWDFDWQTFANYDKVEALISDYGNLFSYHCRKNNEWLYSASKLAEKSWGGLGDYDYDNDRPYMWYPLLFKDAAFCDQVQSRWSLVYPKLLSVIKKIDELAIKNHLSDTYNYAMWPQIELKRNTSAFNGDEDLSFDEAVASMKQAYSERLEWMNNNITSGNFVTNAN